MRNNLTSLVPLLERLTVFGMMAGVVGMFQPWDILWYGWGFIVLVISTLAFIVVSHLPTGEG
jgi:hypothetical protein